MGVPRSGRALRRVPRRRAGDAVSPVPATIPDAGADIAQARWRRVCPAAAKAVWASLPSRPAASGRKPARRLLHCRSGPADAARLKLPAFQFALAAHPAFAGSVVF